MSTDTYHTYGFPLEVTQQETKDFLSETSHRQRAEQGVICSTLKLNTRQKLNYVHLEAA